MNHKRSKIIVIVMTIAGIVFIGAVTVLLFMPTYTEVKKLADTVLDSQAELEAQYSNRKNLVESSSKIDDIKRVKEELVSQFIGKGEELTFIQRTEEIGENRGIETKIVLSAEKSKKKKPTDEPEINNIFDITFSGESLSVYRAIADIERLSNLVIIESTEIRADEIPLDEGVPQSMSAKLRGFIVFTPDKLL